MNKLFSIFLLNVLGLIGSYAQTVTGNGYPYTQVPFTSVKITPNTFWGQRIRAAREVTVPLAFSKCETEGRYENFVKAAHPNKEYDVSTFMGFPFDDTDVYKTIEGASYILQTYPDERLKAYIDSVLDIVAAAQETDGYLYTARTINPEKPQRWSGDRRWVQEEVLSHELYNLGHMVEAACAHYQATGSTKFLNIAKRYADCVIREIGPHNGQVRVVPGHQIAEMALARLYVLLSSLPALEQKKWAGTDAKKYLDEAEFFLDERGKTEVHDIYTQSDKPILEQKEAWGHAVRAGYQYAGMADVAALTGDSAYIKAIDIIWNNIVSKKYYITGGVGARHEGEAFGADYELPNLTAYNETCAAIAQVYFNHRMFLLHGESKYIDCLERTLYNGVISGMSVDGGRFFYPNPLSSDGKYKFNADGTITRQPWFGCACCPSNLSRFIPSLPNYIYAVKDRNIYVNLFAGNTAKIHVDGKDVEIEQVTDYPWNGDVVIRVLKNRAGTFTMKIRIPGWARNQVVPSSLYEYADGEKQEWNIEINGNLFVKNTDSISSVDADGYLSMTRSWRKGDVIRLHLEMPARVVKANEKVLDDKGKIVIERGPLVYCGEWADNKGIDVHHVIFNQSPQFDVLSNYGIRNTEERGNIFYVTALQTSAQEAQLTAEGKVKLGDVRLTLIPYYAWNHRGAGNMAVWLTQGLGGMDNQ
ncbi:MAG: glycoside hydrolase family 127 protein [Prevotella sp.]|nr:glycoside hydrolase family 127 protein [Prevotella sp.]